jgi:hypothetical protein
LKGSQLAWNGNSKPELPCNLIDTRGSAQAGGFERKLPIELLHLRLLSAKRFELIAKLNALEVLPRVNEGQRRKQTPKTNQAQHSQPTIRRNRTHQAGVVDPL